MLDPVLEFLHKDCHLRIVQVHAGLRQGCVLPPSGEILLKPYTLLLEFFFDLFRLLQGHLGFIELVLEVHVGDLTLLDVLLDSLCFNLGRLVVRRSNLREEVSRSGDTAAYLVLLVELL